MRLDGPFSCLPGKFLAVAGAASRILAEKEPTDDRSPWDAYSSVRFLFFVKGCSRASVTAAPAIGGLERAFCCCPIDRTRCRPEQSAARSSSRPAGRGASPDDGRLNRLDDRGADCIPPRLQTPGRVRSRTPPTRNRLKGHNQSSVTQIQCLSRGVQFKFVPQNSSCALAARGYGGRAVASGQTSAQALRRDSPGGRGLLGRPSTAKGAPPRAPKLLKLG